MPLRQLTIPLASIAALISASSLASADPVDPPAATPAASSPAPFPATATAAFVAAMPPGMAIPNNVHLDVSCADYWATPDRGLHLSIDGGDAQPFGVNGSVVEVTEFHHHGTTTDDVWVPSDVGFSVPPGPHHLAIDAPGCGQLASDVNVGMAPVDVTGRLPITDHSLMGTLGAPNGVGVALGAYTHAFGASTTSNPVVTTSNTATSTTGGLLTVSFERRHLVLATDLGVGEGSVTTTTNFPSPATSAADLVESRFDSRIGVRWPFGNVALAAGTGVGLDLLVTSPSMGSIPSTVEPEAFIPLWAAATYKPTCSFGVQAYASYDVYPGQSAYDAPTFGASLLWQPSAACSEPSGLRVTGS